ncbi:acetyl-CoA carboxylase biotin carboxylase subunit [Lachnobacterium bovis]|uniref:Biotin carboxylase n=1 Tax=Lachnobacterium bovis DSM 14045 TaxID=1122142 RepID=A0A1H3I658_9FIRM|nr:acetyl-CoA carboxylase biotin carboxylase subunit [Lachnobacterium bovis]SDY23167.1 acetyl-CoA carboxylase, biotin carboxylase subunit [Lachnobacterium bovis DSM 14045]
MFKRILIANRGEIALRIIRCCREMGIETVVVYSTEDKDSLPVILATKAVCIGPAKSKDSYLNEDVLIETAKLTEADAIHPGYGFLSENAEFAQKCEDNGINFIGPNSFIINGMGDKQNARKLMIKNGVPVVPGSKSLVNTWEEASKIADEIGYPVLIKASAGGGGKGMRKAFSPDEIKSAYETAKAETLAAFNNGDMYVEKLIVNPHHIEVQILADKYGNMVYLGERDCSIQKNNQKLLEESPSWVLDDKLRHEMGQVALKAAKACNYYSAGTVEFVLDEKGNYYFIEMNTRVQVEHPVTEVVTGVDIIKEQIRIAAGMKLSYTQEDIDIEGHGIECRINALTPGTVKFVHFPAGYGVRVESYLYSGCKVSPVYDSMIAKIIVKGQSRLEAIKRMRRALEELVIEGIKTNAEYMHILTFHPSFISGNYNTGFYEKNNEEIMKWLNEGVD